MFEILIQSHRIEYISIIQINNINNRHIETFRNKKKRIQPIITDISKNYNHKTIRWLYLKRKLILKMLSLYIIRECKGV